MHDQSFSQSVRPATVCILGLRLHPYSIGHEILLLSQGNPLLAGKEDFNKNPAIDQRAAIIRAVLICCQGWKANQKPHKWLWLWFRRIRKADFALSVADFRNYRINGSTHPPAPSAVSDTMNRDDGGGRNLGGPFMARLYNFIAMLPDREIKMHGDCAWDFPFGLANYLYFSFLESEGSMRIQNEAEAQFDKLRNEILKEQAERRKSCPA